ncbi:MAG: IclR family transcriptional regulator [Azospirillaceae bacterium]
MASDQTTAATARDHAATPRRPDGSPPDTRYMVPGLERGLKVFALFNRQRKPLTLTEIAAGVGLSRSATFRLVYTLETLGFLEKAAGDTAFRLTSFVLDLGFSYLASLDILDLAEEPLRSLRDRTGAAVHLARREGREIVYLMRLASTQELTSNVQVGARLPAHATSLGRMLLTDLDDEALATLYGGVDLAAATKNTATTIADLIRLIGEDRQRGYVLGHGIFERRLDTLAAPIRDGGGRVIAAVSIVGHDWDFTDEARMRFLTEAVLETAGKISERLGNRR